MGGRRGKNADQDTGGHGKDCASEKRANGRETTEENFFLDENKERIRIQPICSLPFSVQVN